MGLGNLICSVLSWLESNAGLDVFGQSLKTRISNAMFPQARYHLTTMLLQRPSLSNGLYREWPRWRWVDKHRQSYAWECALAVGDCGLGWADPKARSGDWICILQGCDKPKVLREKERGGWNLVDNAIISLAMHGEHMNTNDCGYLDIY